jgi:hypothetical protein
MNRVAVRDSAFGAALVITAGVGVHRGAASVGWVRTGTAVRVAAAGVALLVTVAGCASSVSTAEYQGLLTGFEQAVQPPIDRLVGAESVDEVAAAKSELAAAMQAQEQVLQDVTPPDNARGQHDAVLTFLRSAPRLLALAPPDAKPNECGFAPGAEEQAAKAKAAVRQELETAASGVSTTALAGAGLTFNGSLVPPSVDLPPLQDRRGENGAVLQRNGPRGRGTLEIKNGGGSDAVIAAAVSDPAAPTASIYVRAQSTAKLTGLAGTYQVYFKSGTDWDGQALKFTRDCAFQKFDDSFDANSNWTITVTPVAGGNATSSDVPAF